MTIQHKIFGVNFVLTFLFLVTFLSVQGQNKKYFKLNFNIKNYKGEPVDYAGIHFETDNIKENRVKGKKKEYTSINFKNGETKGTVSLLSSKFANRSVTILVFGPDNLYDKIYELKNVILAEGQTYDIQIERDWEKYNNRKRSVNIVGNGGTINKLMFYQGIFSNSYEIEVFTSDLENIPNDYIIVSFSIDSNCTIANRQLIKTISGMKSDISNDFLNEIENKLKKTHKNKCVPVDSTSIQINWTGWKR